METTALSTQLDVAAADAMAPREYVECFLAKTIPEEGVIGLCGRFIRGVKPEDFHRLSDEPGKVLSWVCNDELLSSVLGFCTFRSIRSEQLCTT